MLQPSTEDKPSRPVDILVVDDHREITDLLAEALDDEGYRVRVAHDGLSALQAMQQRLPDLLILDVAMPLMTGDQVVGRLRREGAVDLPIILMTADRAPERFTGVGANQLLRKPFDLGNLIRLVADYVGLRPPSPPRRSAPPDAQAA